MQEQTAQMITPVAERATDPPRHHPARGTLLAIDGDGSLLVRLADGSLHACDWLEAGAVLSTPLAPGDAVLVATVEGGPGVVLGRVTKYQAAGAARNVTLQAAEQLTLRCGESSIDLRADGKVMIRGEDVLVRAKGTKRIRAGTVSIN